MFSCEFVVVLGTLNEMLNVIVNVDVVLYCVLTVLPSSLSEVLTVAVALSRPLLEHIHCLVVTLGANGLLVCGEHDAGSINLQPRKQKKARTAYIFLFIIIIIIILYYYDSKSEDELHVVITAEAALCSPLPSSDCDTRGDSECIRSRR